MKHADWARTVWAKAAAFVLAAVMVPLACACIASIALGYESGWMMHKQANLYESDFVISAVSRNAGQVWDYLQYEGGNIADSWLTDTEHTNYRFAICDEDGEELFSNIGTNDQVISNLYYYTSNDGMTLRSAVAQPMGAQDEIFWAYRLTEQLYALYPHAAAMTAVSAAVFIALLVFLACVSARRPAREEVVPNWQEKLPFDLYLLVDGVLAAVLILVLAEALRNFYLVPFVDVLALGTAAGLAVLFLGLWMTLCARVKLGQWWRNTVIFRLLGLCWRILKWLGRNLRAVGRGLLTLLRGIPLVWKTVLLLAAICLYELICIAGLHWNVEGLFVSWLLEKLILCAGVLFLALQLRRLQESGAALAAGDLDAKVDTRHMYWDFRRHGENLNAISQGMGIAVEKQLKSERLKTELITNVSHDIKTPLTSIINYVDLLRRDHTPEQQEEYLSVLDRQSRKLKKLTEDLVEVSKASTGNLPVNASRRSISELLSQALGEYCEKLEGAQLEPVLSLPQHDLFACVDGTLMWRVLDNLFSNACKYAQSGTRLYIDAAERDGQVCLAFKNISRERLNIPADELLERFVRGDSARSTEGSGLGLNIARSLTELQGGTFSLSIDGDLFKVELMLPQAA